MTSTLTQDLDLNGDVDVDSIVDLARRPSASSWRTSRRRTTARRVNLEVNDGVYLNVAVNLNVKVNVEVMVEAHDLVATAGSALFCRARSEATAGSVSVIRAAHAAFRAGAAICQPCAGGLPCAP